MPPNYAGIFLHSTESDKSFYKRLGFIEPKNEDLMILDKTDEKLSQIEKKLPNPITIEFYSTYPDNQIT